MLLRLLPCSEISSSIRCELGYHPRAVELGSLSREWPTGLHVWERDGWAMMWEGAEGVALGVRLVVSRDGGGLDETK